MYQKYCRKMFHKHRYCICFHFQVYVFILKPSTLFCYITHFGFNLTITLIYAPLLVKTTRVYRIFAASENFDRELRCVSLSSQLFITWIVCVMQVGHQSFNIFIYCNLDWQLFIYRLIEERDFSAKVGIPNTPPPEKKLEFIKVNQP